MLPQPIFLENLRTTTEPNTKYVVAPFSLTRKWVFSMLSPIKIKGLSHQKVLVHPVNEYASRQQMIARLKFEAVFS